jgi:hypothetical protein
MNYATPMTSSDHSSSLRTGLGLLSRITGMGKEAPFIQIAVGVYGSILICIVVLIFVSTALGLIDANPNPQWLTEYALFSEASTRMVARISEAGQPKNALKYALIEVTIPYLNVLAGLITAGALANSRLRALLGPPPVVTRWGAAIFVVAIYFVFMNENSFKIDGDTWIGHDLNATGPFLYLFVFLHFVGGMSIIIALISAAQTYKFRSTTKR